MPISEETIGEFLGRLAARVPAPGGAVSAALQAALAAGLLAMVARYTAGGRDPEQEAAIKHIVSEADELRRIALRLADADADAFRALAEAYRLPPDTPQEDGARSDAISRALVNVVWPPAQVISVAAVAVNIAEALAAIGTSNVIAEVAAAAEAARAAAATARVSIEVNLPDIADEQASLEIIAQAGKADEIVARAQRVAAAVREQIRP